MQLSHEQITTILGVFAGTSLTSAQCQVRDQLMNGLMDLQVPQPPLDLTKPVQTRDGRQVRLLATDVKNIKPVVGLIWQEKEQLERFTFWTADGRSDTLSTDLDLVNVPPAQKPRHRLWVNLYPHHLNNSRTHEQANAQAGAGRIACIEVEFEEGEGLS